MNKNELVETVSRKCDLSKTDTERAINAFVDTVIDELKKSNEVRLVGFGTFAVTRSTAREGRNPRTGAKIMIPASNQPRFRAGRGFKDALN